MSCTPSPGQNQGVSKCWVALQGSLPGNVLHRGTMSRSRGARRGTEHTALLGHIYDLHITVPHAQNMVNIRHQTLHQHNEAKLITHRQAHPANLGHVGLRAERGRALAVGKAVDFHARGPELAAHFLAGFWG